MARVLIIYNNIEVLKDFTDLLKRKEFTLQCISVNGVTLVSALEYHPDIIIVEACAEEKCERFLKKMLNKKFLFKASIYVYSKEAVIFKDLPGIKLFRTVDELEVHF